MKNVRYTVEAVTSASFNKVCKQMPVTVKYGPWKRLLTAKRKAREMRADRALFWTKDGSYVKDYGPTYKPGSVKIVTEYRETV